MRYLYLFLLVTLLGCDGDDVSTDCVDPSRGNLICPAYYSPVCGCNGVTYSNPTCAAGAGVKTWTDGACK